MAQSNANFANLAQINEPVRVFDEARDSFIASLPKKERMLFAPCSSAEDLLDGIKKLHIIRKQSQNWKISACLKRIRAFSDALTPYFEVVTIFVSSNPQYTALLWGALRLILQVSDLRRNTVLPPTCAQHCQLLVCIAGRQPLELL